MARRLSEARQARVVISLAGRTVSPEPMAGEVRVGGFGGAVGLARYLRASGIDLVVDATHPFASTISAHAAAAADAVSVPRVVLRRPAWRSRTGDDWRCVASLDDAAKAIDTGARVFLALGRQHIGDFATRRDVHFVVRMVDQPEMPLPFESFDLILGRPSLGASEEAAMLRTFGITCIVCRNSGGEGAAAKLVAARNLHIPVVMIRRPPPPSGRTFASVDGLMSAVI